MRRAHHKACCDEIMVFQEQDHSQRALAHLLGIGGTSLALSGGVVDLVSYPHSMSVAQVGEERTAM